MPANNQYNEAQKRDDKGRFLAGNVGGPGRPDAVTEQKYLVRLHDRVSMDDWDSIIAQAIADAREGNWKARQWLSDYCLGKPATQAAAPLVDNRQVTFDLSNLSREQLTDAIRLAQLVNAPGRIVEAESE